jgi:thiol-activated cytolysin
MKRILLKITILALTISSCSKEVDEAAITPSLNELKSVNFESVKQADKVISSTKTNNVITVGNTSQFEYLTTVEKTFTLLPISPPKEVNDVIYPGSILSGEDFLRGKYTPLRLSVKFNPVTLTTDLRGVGLGDPIQMNPSLSGFNQVINNLITNKNLKPELVPGDSDYTSEELTTSEKSNKTLKIHADFNYLSVVKANFDFQKSELTTRDEKFVIISFRQKIFNASIDAQYKTNWIDGAINPAECGSHEPLYISSVDYGRVAYLKIKTTETAEKINQTIKASVNVAFSKVGGGIDFESSKQLERYFTDKKITVYTRGGTTAITDLASFNQFVTEPANSTKIGAAVPISYRVRRIRDNSDVDVIGVYRDDILEYKAN